MGYPLSPVMVNIFMEDFEITALMTAEKQPKVWKRYVDDTWERPFEQFLTHIYSLHSNTTLH